MEWWLSGFSVLLVKKGMGGQNRGRRKTVQQREELLPRILAGGQEVGENILEKYYGASEYSIA